MIGDRPLSLTGTLISSMANASPPVSALTLARTMDSRLVPDRLLAEHGARTFAGPGR